MINPKESKMSENPADWQINANTISKRGIYLLETGWNSDCSFAVGDDLSNQKIFNCHKLFLSTYSPVFQAQLYGPLAEKLISISDITAKNFKTLLCYIYTDEIKITTNEEAYGLFYCGKKYMLPILIDACVSYLQSKLTPDNVCQVYEFAKLYEEKNLLNKCLAMFCEDTSNVLNASSFINAEIDTLLTIYSLGKLDIDSEMDLFNALVKYSATRKTDNNCKLKLSEPKEEEIGAANGAPTSIAKIIDENRTATTENKSAVLTVSCPEVVNELSAPKSVGIEPVDHAAASNPQIIHENTKATTKATTCHPAQYNCGTIRDALKQIRFLTMTPEQFSDGPALSPLLSDTEKLSIFINISSKHKNIPMPNGFSCLYTRCRDYTRPPVCQNCKPKHESVFGAQIYEKGNGYGFCHVCKKWAQLYHFPKSSAFPFSAVFSSGTTARWNTSNVSEPCP